MRDLALFVQVPKTGSTSMRRLFHTAAADGASGASSASGASHAPWLCQRSADVDWPCDVSAEVVLGGAWVYGTGDVYRSHAGRWRRGHRALTTLREPIARTLSAYQYFHRACGDRGKFRAITGCGGNLSFVGWAQRTANHYVRLFSAYQPPGKHMFGAWIDEDAAPRALGEPDVARAFAALTRPSTLVLWLETDLAGAPEAQRAALSRLRAWLGEAGAARAATALANATAFPYENAVPPEARYAPSATERRAVCAANWADCALYARLRNRSCAC